MKFAQAFSAILSARGYTQTGLADDIGVSRQAVTQLIRKNNPTVDSLDRYLARLGYRVALVPVGARLPDGSYVLEGSDHA